MNITSKIVLVLFLSSQGLWSLSCSRDTPPPSGQTEQQSESTKTATARDGKHDKRKASERKPAVVVKSQQTTVKPATAASFVPPGLDTVEGEVLQIDGSTYLVKDISGRNVAVLIDNKTHKDGNITVGDEIVARLDNGNAQYLRKR